MKHLSRIFVLLVLCSASPRALGLEFTAMEPAYGAPGDSITLNGSGFDAMAAYVVTVDGLMAVIEEVQTDFLRFTIPPAATTGPVEVSLDTETFNYRSHLIITTDITVTLDPALPAYTDDYVVGTLYDEDEPPGPSFTVPVVDGEVTLVTAAGEDSEPGLLGIATGLDPGLELSAESSALAVAFMVPQVFTIDPVEAVQVLTVLAALPEVQILTDLVDDEIAAASDYLAGDTIDAALLAAVEAYLDEVAAEPQRSTRPESPQGGPPPIHDDFIDGIQDFALNYPRDLKVTGFEALNRLEASALPLVVSRSGVPTRGIKMDQAPLDDLNAYIEGLIGLNPDLSGTGLEWLAVVYELDPADPALDSKAKVDVLAGSNTAIYDRLNPGQLSKRVISAKPVIGYLDFVGTLADMVFSKAFPVFQSEKDVRIATDRSGLYIVRSFSGARFPPQAPLFEPATGLPGGEAEHVKMLVLNLIMAANEASGMILKSKDVVGDSKLAEILVKLDLALTTAIERQLAVGEINSTFVWTLFNEAAKLLAKELTGTVVKQSLEAGLSAATGKQLAKVILKNLNILGKIVAGLKVAERVAALSNVVNYLHDNAWMGQSSQSTIAVMGNPWRPEITSFSPRQGHKGQFVWISGRRFSPTIADNIVLFGSLSTDPENPPEPEQAEVLEASSNTLKVRVPQGAMTGVITVAIQGRGFFSTAALAPPYLEFVVLERPVITAIDPFPPPAGGFARIVGNHFAAGYGVNLLDQNVVKFASQGGASTPVEIAAPTSLLVRIPDNGNPNSVTVQTEGCSPDIIAECTSDPFPFTAALPPVGTLGGNIWVTTTGDGDVEDGDISLHEAMLIAAGTLGRPLTEPPDPRPPDTTYESDFANLGSGASKRDHILPHASFPGGTIVLAQALPPLESFDIYELTNFVVDGTAVAGPALVVNGKSGIEFTQNGNSITTFQNFGGHGLHLSGGASGNEFFRLIFDNCGGEGVFLDTAASGNFILTSTSNCTLNGLRLSGVGVEANEIQTVLFPGSTSLVFRNDGNEGFGVLLEEGANGNVLRLGHTRNNTLGGLRVTGAGTEHNKITGGEGAVPVEIFDNGGLGVPHDRPGVWIDVPNTYVADLNVAGNNGDGVLVEGAGTHSVKIEYIFAGYVYATNAFPAGSVKANQGNGIHFRNDTHDNDASLLYLGGNSEHGVLITGAGVHDISILSGSIGRPFYKSGGPPPFINLPNVKSGIAIMDGAHDNVIGYPILTTFLGGGGVRVMNHQTDAPDSGAGILLSGMNTTGNIVFGSVLGSDGLNLANVGNRYGIRITGGAHANVIGLRGEPGTSQQPTMFVTHNLFQNNTVAGILLESGGSLPGGTSTGEPQTPAGGNVIQNNHFGHTIDVIQVARPNRVGVLIRQDGVANRIGGSQPGEANYFWDNDRAGLEIEGAVISRPDLANRIIGNVFQNQGSKQPPVADPLAGDPVGAGVLISGGASGHIIGGIYPGEGNRIVADVDPHPAPDGNITGVYIDASSNNEVIGNQIGGDTQDGGNVFAGVIIRDGTGNVIGPGNRIGPNGDPFMATLGGVAISGGSENMVVGNRIGPAPDQDFDPNDPVEQRNQNGVLILNSTNNIIGDQGAERANVIVGSTTNGVRIEGAGSTGNQVANNQIGISGMGETWVTGNGVTGPSHSGVLITGGASGNIIGGERPVPIGNSFVSMPAGNTIRQNRGDGVRVEAASLGNTIIHNSISEHAARPGIQNIGGGNGELPPPSNLAFGGLEVSGTVNAASVPDGSLVQIFSDPDDEGWQLIAQAVVDGGAFSAPVGMLNHAKVCATATHATNGNTSEFSCFTATINPALDIRRAEEPPEVVEVAPGQDNVMVVMAITTQDFAARVESMNFDASGSADESTAVSGVSLYRDADDNGFLSFGDQLLAGPVPVAADDGTAVFADIDASIPGNTVQHWLLVVSLDAAATLGQTIEFTLANNTEVDSSGILPSGPITESGNFPLLSDLGTIAFDAPPTAQEIQQAITSGMGIDPDMDVNGDGQVDVADVVAAGNQ